MRHKTADEDWVNWYKKDTENPVPSHNHREEYLEFISFIKTLNLKANILEVGCGGGELLSHWENVPDCNVFAIDLIRDFIISSKCKNNNISYICGDALALPFKNSSFDVIIISDLLHHLVSKSRSQSMFNIDTFFHEVKRCIRNGGYILIRDLAIKYKISSYLIFFITLLCSKMDISIPIIQVNRGIVICFPTLKEVDNLMNKYSFINRLPTKRNNGIFPSFLGPFGYLIISQVIKRNLATNGCNE